MKMGAYTLVSSSVLLYNFSAISQSANSKVVTLRDDFVAAWQGAVEVWEYCDIIATGNIRVCVLVSDVFDHY